MVTSPHSKQGEWPPFCLKTFADKNEDLGWHMPAGFNHDHEGDGAEQSQRIGCKGPRLGWHLLGAAGETKAEAGHPARRAPQGAGGSKVAACVRVCTLTAQMPTSTGW